MGRCWFGSLLLLVLLGFGLWSTFSADAMHRPVSEALEQAAELSLSGQLEEGISLAQGAKADWENNWHTAATTADHAPMDEIDGLFAQMEVYARVRQGADFDACCARLSRLIHAMGEAHSPGWWNLL